MPGFETIPLNVPGAGGLDLVSEETDKALLRCRRLTNFDIVPAVEEDGRPRVLPRGLLRRWGFACDQSISVALAVSVALGIGLYNHFYMHDDGAGTITYSKLSAINTTAGNQQIDVSGWPLSGTVSLYRTPLGGGGSFYLVAIFSGATATYNDTVADGSLGAAFNADAAFRALYSNAFAQAVRVHHLKMMTTASGANKLLLAIGSSLVYYGYPYVFEGIQATGGSGGTDRPCSIAALGEMLWAAVGGTALKYLALGNLTGGLTSLSQPATPTLTISGYGAGSLTTATGHSYIAIRIDPETGVRSLPSTPVTTTIGGPRSVNLTCTSASGVDFEIYRTSDGGQFFQYLKTETGGGAFSDQAADSTLSQKTASVSGQLAGVPDSGFRHVAAHKGLIFAANKLSTTGVEAAPSLLVNSGPDPFNFPQDPFIAVDYERQIDEDDGDEITGLKSWGEVLLTFKRKRVYQLMGDPPVGFRVAAIPGSDSAGCVSERTIQETPAGVFWLSPAGVQVMREPGAPPALVSDALRDLLIDPERLAALETDTSTAPRSERPGIDFELRNRTAAALTARHVRIQFSLVSTFSLVTADYDTGDAADLPLFLVNNADYPAAGIALGAGAVRRINLRLPAGVLTPGTAYYVRYAIGDGSTWGSWVDLPRYTRPASDVLHDRVNWGDIQWSFAVHLAKRQEYWLFLPTGERTYCDAAYVLNYGAILRGTGGPLWRGPLPLAATAGCVIDNLGVGGQAEQDYLLLASPDGLLYLYPWLHGLIDHDTRISLTAAQRNFTGAAVSGATLTPASSPSWPTTWPGLRGQCVVVRDADGATFTGLISANTASAVTVVWLGGRAPAGTVEAVVGGLETVLETGWLNLSGDAALTAIVREMQFQAAPPRATLDVELFAAEAPQAGVVNRPAVEREIPIGEGFGNSWTRFDLRGRFHRLRLSAIDARPYEVSAVQVGVEQTGSHV